MKLLIALLVLLQMPYVSKYLTFKEATQTSVSVGCTSNASALAPSQLELVRSFGKNYFDPLRERVGAPLYVSSMFRSKCVNSRIGGSKTSEHMILGQAVAADIDQDGRRGTISNPDLFHLIRTTTQFRQLIWEFGTDASPAWVHVSWSPNPAMNVRKVYRCYRVGNRTVYTNY